MRLRNVLGSEEKVKNHQAVINNPNEYKGKWKSEYFKNEKPLYIEIGMGKGGFILENAKTYPEINFIGIERISGVLARGTKKIDQSEEEIPNLCLLRIDAIDLLELFAENEVDKIYLNFSDPWPKERYKKRRLTHINFLEKYKIVLKKDEMLKFKTDNKELFNFSLKQLKKTDFEMSKFTRDLHNSEHVKGNIMTEYEQKFVNMGININMLEVKNIKGK